jgi:hypothetical protein
MRIDSRPEPKVDSVIGRYMIRTFWSGNGTQLVSAISLRTKDSHDAEFTIVRELADGGKTIELKARVSCNEIWSRSCLSFASGA